MHYPHTTKDNRGFIISVVDSEDSHQEWTYDEKGRKTEWRQVNFAFGPEAKWQKNTYHGDTKVVATYEDSDGLKRWFNASGVSIKDPNAPVELTILQIAKMMGCQPSQIRIKDYVAC